MKHTHIKSRLDDILFTEAFYERHIPKNCILQTAEEHKKIMYCWRLFKRLERREFRKICKAECDFNSTYKKPKHLTGILR